MSVTKWVNRLIGVTIIFPILILCLWAFTARWPWPHLLPQNFSMRGFEELIRQPDQLMQVCLSSLFISVLVSIISTVIALMFARLWVFRGAGWRTLITISLVLPFIIPVTVFVTGIYQWMIQMKLVNRIEGVILLHLVYTVPYAGFLLIDAYQAIGSKLEEQAWLLGARPSVAFRKISLPLMIPMLVTSLSMAFIISFSQYFLTLMIGGGQVRTLTILIFPYLQANDRTIASVYSLLFLGLSLVVMLIIKVLGYLANRRYQESNFY